MERVFQELIKAAAIENQLTGTIKMANEERDPDYRVDGDVKLMGGDKNGGGRRPQPRGGPGRGPAATPRIPPPAALSPEAAQQFRAAQARRQRRRRRPRSPPAAASERPSGQSTDHSRGPAVRPVPAVACRLAPPLDNRRDLPR